MANKNRFVLAAAAALLSLGLATTALAAPSNFSVQADELEYDLGSGEAVAKGSVVLKQDGGVATANYARFNSKTKSGVLTGNVVADREDMHIICNEFIVHNENDLSAVGGASIS